MLKQVSNKKQYSQEFKEQVLEVLENSPKSTVIVAKEFGVAYPTLMSWVAAKGKKSDSKQNQDETKKLKQEVEILKKENEILKKAAAFFAKQLD